MFGQVFHFADLGVVAILVLLEGLLSADNALVLAIMVRHLPKDQQRKALLYGLGGAFVFRLVAILLAVHIMALWWLQAIGAIYLLYLPVKHFTTHGNEEKVVARKHDFWKTVLTVEIADIAFALDSVLAAVAMVHNQTKIWVVYLGAIIGVVLLRFAASFFIRLLERYPDLDHVAYALVGWVGVKLSFMALHNYSLETKPGWTVHEIQPVTFWIVMAVIALAGSFVAIRRKQIRDEESPECDMFGDVFDDDLELRRSEKAVVEISKPE